jgi:regulator of protease activity HflC (stomatin/prohibitin superfamily)
MDEFFQELTGMPFEWGSITQLPGVIWAWAFAWGKENMYVVAVGVWSAFRAMGATVESGNTGLFFSFGKATRVLEPGFVFKIPYFQKVEILPTRARTLDVPNQKVTSLEGLVWFVDVNLVYRVVDIRKALIEVDELEEAMKQMLGLSVQEIVRHSLRNVMRLSGGLDEALEKAMGSRLEAWGVEVDSVGFTSVRPSPQTLRFTQQQHACEVRAKALDHLESEGISRGYALAMLGTPAMPRRRALAARQYESLSRRKRRILRWSYRAEKASEIDMPARLRVELRKTAVRNLDLYANANSR